MAGFDNATHDSLLGFVSGKDVNQSSGDFFVDHENNAIVRGETKRADATLMNIFGLQGIAETINTFASEENLPGIKFQCSLSVFGSLGRSALRSGLIQAGGKGCWGESSRFFQAESVRR
jgi:hypothetical protein